MIQPETNKRRRGRKYQLAKAKKQILRPDTWAASLEPSDKILILACGALSKEISALIRLNNWTHLKTRYLPAILHNSPDKITEQLRNNLQSAQAKFSRIFIGYADCGTGGEIDSMLDEFGVQRLPGAHCYEFYSGNQSFAEMMDEEPGSFFLTDFLVEAFEKLVKSTREDENVVPIFLKKESGELEILKSNLDEVEVENFTNTKLVYLGKPFDPEEVAIAKKEVEEPESDDL